jgi:hypothetical protein
MKITKEQFEKFNDELKEFGMSVVFYKADTDKDNFVCVLKGIELVAHINETFLTFDYWTEILTLTEKCNILKVASKYFAE